MNQRVVFFDLETGGLDPDVHPVSQFAGIATEVTPEGFQELEELELKIVIVPEACSPEALEMNSYDPEVWAREAIVRNYAVQLIDEFLRDHATLEMPKRNGGTWKACQMAGHNAEKFDRPFLQSLYGDTFCPASFRVLDTLQLAMWWRQVFGAPASVTNLKLETLCKVLGVEPGGHDALGDVRATIRVAERILQEMRAL